MSPTRNLSSQLTQATLAKILRQLVYLKKGIFRLSEEARIPPDDPYWLGFWELPESVEDVFSLFSSSDIRCTRDASLENLETLILAVTSRLNALRNLPRIGLKRLLICSNGGIQWGKGVVHHTPSRS